MFDVLYVLRTVQHTITCCLVYSSLLCNPGADARMGSARNTSSQPIRTMKSPELKPWISFHFLNPTFRPERQTHYIAQKEAGHGMLCHVAATQVSHAVTRCDRCPSGRQHDEVWWYYWSPSFGVNVWMTTHWSFDISILLWRDATRCNAHITLHHVVLNSSCSRSYWPVLSVSHVAFPCTLTVYSRGLGRCWK